MRSFEPPRRSAKPTRAEMIAAWVVVGSIILAFGLIIFSVLRSHATEATGNIVIDLPIPEKILNMWR